MAKNKVQIVVATYDAHEMGFVIIDGKSVFTGNFWDFHSGCHGTKIGGYELNGIWDRGISSLATALKVKIEETGSEVEVLKKQLTSKEYKALGF